MEAMHMTLGLILARGGSKRLVGKNLMPLAGKSLVVHAIECGRAAPSIGRVVVSTDCPAIAAEARAAGADVPFLRPAYLAADDSISEAAAIHALNQLGIEAGIVVLLQPTSPLRLPADIEDVLEYKARRGCASVVTTDRSGNLNGAVYAVDVPVFLRERSFCPKGTEYWSMPDERSIDVDTVDDFRRAERVLLAQDRSRVHDFRERNNTPA
jgi:CMP-N-acetylneuraminic acid synthetase